MKKYSYPLILVALLFATISFAQKAALTNAQRWEKVTELAEKQLPESALKEVESILQQAQKENNSVETIKALVYKMRFALEKNPEESPKLIHDFEVFTEKTTDIAEKALLHSMTAELFGQYYNLNSWTINRRTELQGSIPKEMKEWSKNIYFDKIKKHLAASIANESQLQNTDAEKFSLLMQLGEDSKRIQPTLFDFLIYRKITILEGLYNICNIQNPLQDERLFGDIPVFTSLQLDTIYNSSAENAIVQSYQKLLNFRSKDNNDAALIYANLHRFKYLNDVSESENGDSLYFEALKSIENKYQNCESVVEVLNEKAEFYLNSRDTSHYRLNDRLAYDVCSSGIKKFKDYKRIGLLYNIQKKITEKKIDVKYKSESKPNSQFQFEIETKNIEKLNLSIFKIEASAKEYYQYTHKNSDRIDPYPNRSIVDSTEITVRKDSSFQSIKTSIEIKTRTYGIYEFCIKKPHSKDNNECVRGHFTVTDLAVMTRTNSPTEYDFYVIDRFSGIPQKDIKIYSYDYKWTGNGYGIVPSTDSTLRQTNKIGFLNLPYKSDNNGKIIFLEKGEDRYFSTHINSTYHTDYEYENKNTQVSLFADRSLYRPGQTVYFKGIAYFSHKSKQEIIPNSRVNVSLKDIYSRKIKDLTLFTNEFGSFSGSFRLPTSSINGLYRLTSNGSHEETFRVEEYKRPTFEVKISSSKKEVMFGKKVTFFGSIKAFAGYNISNANINYQIIRRPNLYCWRWSTEKEKVLISGSIKSENDGTFKVAFTPQKVKLKTKNDDQYFNYVLKVDVTDSKGETQKGIQSIPVGVTSCRVGVIMDDKVNVDSSDKIRIYTTNLNGENLNKIVNYSVYSNNNDSIYNEDFNEDFNENSNKNGGTKILSGVFDTKNIYLKIDYSKLPLGRNKIVVNCIDTFGREVKMGHFFILYNSKEKKVPVKCYTWLKQSKNKCKIGESIDIQFGTSLKNINVLYEVKSKHSIYENRWIKLSDEVKTFKIPYKEIYGDQFKVEFSFVKNSKYFSKTIDIEKEEKVKTLSPTLSVFRNKLLPGELAEWTVSIPEVARNRKPAELMIDMYDASLDAICGFRWDFDPTVRKWNQFGAYWSDSGFGICSKNKSPTLSLDIIPEYKLNQLDWFGMRFNSSQPMMIRGSRIREDENVPVFQENGIHINEFSDFSRKTINENRFESVKPRTNFNETAFFYPQLRTDSMGNVKFSFTVPESLTRWNVKMLAHTKDLDFGQGEAQVVTQKDLMVQMNLPRFVRRSDKLVLSANVVNLTDKKLTSNVKIELIDPATEKTIQLKDAATRKVILAPNETKTVEWEITEFSPYELVTCKVIAQAGNFSDGEQKYLPILPDKVLVTESIPLILRGNENRSFNFDNLLQNGTKVDNKSLTVEFASNPTWYAIQALPSLSKPEGDNAFDYLTAYYANRLAGYIVNSNPKIKSIVEQWKLENGNREALLSNLEKNTELKNILLEETPWIMAAKNDTEQKRQLALLFDLNQQENQAQQYLDKLKTLQLASGGFAWFKGMNESRYVTQAILLNLGRLKKMGDGQRTTDNGPLVINALGYLDLEIARDFENLKRYNKNYKKEYSIDNIQLFYLHLRSAFPEIAIAATAKEAVQFYTLLAEKQWTSLSLYGKAMMAVVAHRNGKIELANNILKSLKENALKTDELGMYWVKNQAGYFWNERPIAVQSAMIEAFSEVSKSHSDVEELKIWLLKQKQTQSWDSPLSNVDAVYALINYGSDWLKSDGKVNIKLGSTEIKSQSSEAGTGYFKQTIPTVEIQSAMGKVTISNQTQSTNSEKNSSIGWGAMYWQYFQSLEKTTQQNGSLSISKKLYLEKMSQQGKQLVPIEQAKIKKGDKIITRLVITTDRSLEFVSLKDLRAACFEPVEQISGYFWKEGIGYYKTSKDASTQFFFSYLPKGTYVFEYELWANSAGDFSSGMATLQCLYAPEFISHSGGERVVISNLK